MAQCFHPLYLWVLECKETTTNWEILIKKLILVDEILFDLVSILTSRPCMGWASLQRVGDASLWQVTGGISWYQQLQGLDNSGTPEMPWPHLSHVQPFLIQNQNDWNIYIYCCIVTIICAFGFVTNCTPAHSGQQILKPISHKNLKFPLYLQNRQLLA